MSRRKVPPYTSSEGVEPDAGLLGDLGAGRRVGGLLVGQTWTQFLDLASYPDVVDFNGPGSIALVRQPAKTVIVPISIYSKKLKWLDHLPRHGKVAARRWRFLHHGPLQPNHDSCSHTILPDCRPDAEAPGLSDSDHTPSTVRAGGRCSAPGDLSGLSLIASGLAMERAHRRRER